MKPLGIYKKILVFNPAFLGDTVLTTPLIRLLKKLYPKSEVYFCVRPEHAPLFKGLDIMDGIITFDKRKKYKGLLGLILFKKHLSSFNFDLVIDLHRSIRSTFICAFLKNATVIGFSSAVLSRFFTYRVDRVYSLHEVEKNLMTISVLFEGFSFEYAKKLAGTLTCFIDKKLFSNIMHYYATVTHGNKIVGIAPGSVWNTKKYLPEYFAQAAEILNQNGYHIALFGGPDDKDATDAFKRAYKGNFYDYAGKTSLRELPAFLASVNILLVNDSGAMHIAIATGIPCVAVFGPTVKAFGFFPYDTKSIVIENKNLSCRPCRPHGGNKCPKNHFKCMKDIKPETVAKAALKILKG